MKDSMQAEAVIYIIYYLCMAHNGTVMRFSCDLHINYYTGMPASPTNLQSVVDVYRDYFSTVIFTWDAPNDNSRIDYYQYEVENGTNSLTYNTSNTTAILSGIYTTTKTLLSRFFHSMALAKVLH